MDRLYYIAQQADAVARRRYAQARSKPQIQGEDLAVLDALVTPLIRKGQPLTHIYAEHGEASAHYTTTLMKVCSVLEIWICAAK